MQLNGITSRYVINNDLIASCADYYIISDNKFHNSLIEISKAYSKYFY